jgi:hypothetical protein
MKAISSTLVVLSFLVAGDALAQQGAPTDETAEPISETDVGAMEALAPPETAPPETAPPITPAARPAAPPANRTRRLSPYRHHGGFMIGAGMGAGATICDGCDAKAPLVLDFNIGWFVMPRLALMFEAILWSHGTKDSPEEFTLVSNLASAQYWLAPRVWVKVGAGGASAEYESAAAEDSIGFAVTAASGYELVKWNSFALDLTGRANMLALDGTKFLVFNATLGLRWK